MNQLINNQIQWNQSPEHEFTDKTRKEKLGSITHKSNSCPPRPQPSLWSIAQGLATDQQPLSNVAVIQEE